MKKLTKELLSQLKWKVISRPSSPDDDGGSFFISSSPQRQEHVIVWPAAGAPSGPPREIEYAHELIHALLCEQVHHQFSGSYFKRGTPEAHVQLVAWACRAASDWFVDAKLIELAPEQEWAEIKEHLDLVRQMYRIGAPQTVFTLLSSGLILSQAIKYLDIQIYTGSQLRRVIDAFLSTPPEIPSIMVLERLINKLLAVYTNMRVQLVKDGGLDVWKVIQLSI